MILDHLGRIRSYVSLHARFGEAIAFLMHGDLATLSPGEYEIDGRRVYVIVADFEGKGHKAARLEAHRRYIDIQVTLAGREEIGWRDERGCTLVSDGFDTAKDIGFYKERPDAWLTLPEQHFAIFFPHDAHAPLAGKGKGRKVVVKIAT